MTAARLPLTARAPGKVNLCLFVGAPRADGLHPLVSLVQPVSLADEVRLEPGEGEGEGGRRVRAQGEGGRGLGAEGESGRGGGGRGADVVSCPGVAGENLAARALAGFRAGTGWNAPPLRLAIAKRVPVAAGMGGGSGDAAATLRLLEAASGLAVPPGLPMALGADVPSQLEPRRVLMTGAGEHVAPLPARTPAALVIVPLDAALSTPAVYRAFDELGLGRPPDELRELEREVRAAVAGGEPLPAELAVNDLEPAARSLCPAVDAALAAVRAQGAGTALVSGSGPTVFGTFRSAEAAERAAAALTASGHPRAVAAAGVTAAFGAVRAA